MGEKRDEYMKTGQLATFNIQVQYLQNATWQGNILWIDGKKSSYFRSALEMLKLMDSALNKAVRREEEIGGE